MMQDPCGARSHECLLKGAGEWGVQRELLHAERGPGPHHV